MRRLLFLGCCQATTLSLTLFTDNVHEYGEYDYKTEYYVLYCGVN